MASHFMELLNEQNIKSVYHSSLKILNQIGVKCDHKKTIDLLHEKSTIKYSNGRILFEIDALEEYFNLKKKQISRQSISDEFRLGGHWHSWELCDPISNVPRPASIEEAVEMAKLSEGLGVSNSPIPVAPGGINPAIHTLLSEKIALIYTKSLGGRLTANKKEQIKLISEMYKAAGRRYKLGLEGLITPLKFNSEIFNTYFDWCDDPDIDIDIMPNIPMAGATAPLIFPANLAFILAEAIALDYVFQVLSDGKLGTLSLRLEPFDMKDMNIVFGSPEWCLFREAIARLWAGLFGKKLAYGSFRTNGKVVDGQTLIERTASFLWQANLGARIFGAVGQLCIDEVYSPVQAILDREILMYGKKLLSGIAQKCWKDIDIIELVNQGVKDDGFLANDTTLDVFREIYDFNRLMDSENLGTWRANGSVTMQEKAWRTAQEIIKKHEFELEDTERKEIEKLYKKGVTAQN